MASEYREYAIGVNGPALRTSRPKALVYRYRFVFALILHCGVSWGVDLWRPSHDTLLWFAGRSVFVALMTSLMHSSGEDSGSQLVVTSEYIEKQYLSPVGTTFRSEKIYRNQIKKVAEVQHRLHGLWYPPVKGLMIIEKGRRHSIFVPETAQEYAAIKAKLLDCISPMRM